MYHEYKKGIMYSNYVAQFNYFKLRFVARGKQKLGIRKFAFKTLKTYFGNNVLLSIIRLTDLLEFRNNSEILNFLEYNGS
jgi:hypothetical protein